MKKLFFIVLLFIISLALPSQVEGTSIAGSSALMADEVTIAAPDNRALVLAKYLKRYNSPLSEYSNVIVAEADKYQIPWTWIPAISGVESTFGQAIPFNSYNGWGWANGEYTFQSWEDAITIITKSLRERYVDRGADTIERIAPIYAPPSTTWSGKVNYFIAQIESFSENDISQLPISL